MKSIDNLITSLYAQLTQSVDLLPLLGYFDTDTLAISYNEVPLAYTLPTRDKLFIVYSIDSSDSKASETKAHLSETVIKLYVSGEEALSAANILIDSLDSQVISSFYCSYRGLTTLPNSDVTIRFKLI